MSGYEKRDTSSFFMFLHFLVSIDSPIREQTIFPYVASSSSAENYQLFRYIAKVRTSIVKV